MRKFIVLVCAALLLSTTINKIYGDEGKQRLRWRFDLFSLISEFYTAKLMVHIGSVGIGTAYKYNSSYPPHALTLLKRNDYSWFVVNDTTYSVDVSHGSPHCYFPVIIRYTPYSRPFLYGDVSMYGEFEASLWSEQESSFPVFEEDVHNKHKYAQGSFRPSYWFKISLGISFNLLRYIPCDLRIGYLRAYYPYHRIPQPYRDHIPHSAASDFYTSLLLSLGYQSAR